MDHNIRKESILSNDLKYSVDNEKQEKQFTKYWDKYVYTIVLLLMNIYCGILGNTFGPTMVDMRYLFKTSMSLISYAITFGSVGYLLGSFSGLLYTYINRQMTLIVVITMWAICYSFTPICTSLWQLYLCTFLANIGQGVFVPGCNVWIIELWKTDSAPLLQLSMAAYGLGSILAPILAKPYILGELDLPTNNVTLIKTTQILSKKTLLALNSKEEYNYSIERRDKLQMPYLIEGGITLSVPIILLMMFILKRYKEPFTNDNQRNESIEDNKTINRIEVPDEYNNKSRLKFDSSGLRCLMIGLIAIIISAFVGLRLMHSSYSSTYYQYLPIKISAQRAADILSVYSATFTVGKLISVFISIKVKAEIMIIYHIIILFISMFTLYFGENSELIIWIGNGLLGFGSSGIWGAFFSFTEDYIGYTDSISSILSITSSICPMISPFIFGPLIESYPDVLLITEFIYQSITAVFFILLYIIVKRSSSSSNN